MKDNMQSVFRLHCSRQHETGKYRILHRHNHNKNVWECMGVYYSKKYAEKDLRKFRNGKMPLFSKKSRYLEQRT